MEEDGTSTTPSKGGSDPTDTRSKRPLIRLRVIVILLVLSFVAFMVFAKVLERTNCQDRGPFEFWNGSSCQRTGYVPVHVWTGV